MCQPLQKRFCWCWQWWSFNCVWWLHFSSTSPDPWPLHPVLLSSTSLWHPEPPHPPQGSSGRTRNNASPKHSQPRCPWASTNPKPPPCLMLLFMCLCAGSYSPIQTKTAFNNAVPLERRRNTHCWSQYTHSTWWCPVVAAVLCSNYKTELLPQTGVNISMLGNSHLGLI